MHSFAPFFNLDFCLKKSYFFFQFVANVIECLPIFATFCPNFSGVLPEFAEICRNSKSRRIQTHPEVSGNIRDRYQFR